MKQLQLLVNQTGLIEQIEAELFEQWCDPDANWTEIKNQLNLLETAGKVLRRMESD